MSGVTLAQWAESLVVKHRPVKHIRLVEYADLPHIPSGLFGYYTVGARRVAVFVGDVCAVSSG